MSFESELRNHVSLDSSSDINSTNLETIMLANYDFNDLYLMCCDVGIDYKDLDDSSLTAKAKAIIEFAKYKGRLKEIIEYVRDTI